MSDARVEELETVCAELYQVIGALAAEAGVYDHPEVTKALDNASGCRLVHKDLLPWPKSPLHIRWNAVKAPPVH